MEKHLPELALSAPTPALGRRTWPLLAVLVLAALYLGLALLLRDSDRAVVCIPPHAAETLAKCRSLNVKPAPPAYFSSRSESDRFEPRTKPILIRNASIWTGLHDGTEIVHGNIFLQQGLIKAVGTIHPESLTENVDIIDAEGAWVTPGIVDVHSHHGVEATPALNGANDGNSINGLTLPWLRSLDALNTHDDGYAHSIAGGVTTSLILPGSADAIGGQAFAIKFRPTTEKSPSSMLVEPPYGLNGSQVNYDVPPRWRHMKHACGENPSRVYSGTRMDTVWSYREAYEHARQIKNKQDTYCEKALAGDWQGLGDFPEDLQWEALVDILRGKVKVQTHCYEAVDFDAFVRLSNEFQFPVAAFHHAHEAYLVPDVLKRAYEHPPAVAIFAAFSRYKREGYRHSEFAPRILNDEGLKVVMKSDHPAIQSRWLLHEVQQAHYYGLPENVALASVTTNAAEVVGLEHRLGYVKQGYDADIVLWDSHPLALGATPLQVFIDGIPQLETPFTTKKFEPQTAPTTPNFDTEAKDALANVGLPPLEPYTMTSGGILFHNVSSMWRRDGSGVHPVFLTHSVEDEGVVLVENGEVKCTGSMASCASYAAEGLRVINLEGGSIAPALVSAGSAIGLQEIAMEASTSDGAVLDPLEASIPGILGDGSIIRAVDGLMFGTRDALLAYRSGVSTAITAPISDGLLAGLSTHLSLGAKHRLERDAVLEDVTAVHVTVSHRGGGASVSTQIAALRRLLLGPYEGERGIWFKTVAEGKVPLVVNVKNADIMATLLKLKKEVEATSGQSMKMTFVGAAEAHLLAAELVAADVGIIVTPPRSFPYTWEGRRTLHGPPVTEQSLITTLFAHGVTVGIGHQGVEEEAQMTAWAARNLRWDAAWASVDSKGLISFADAMTMATTNIEKLLGVKRGAIECDMVATRGGELLSFGGKVVAVTSPRRGVVDIF
ncbi:hypothetical protein F5I97DRAFT_1874828 [Phlebopus sp. FC_14]|nr:hypothetical protein F5I97DRAFT_1874828 [Phlebopus sp. FC_14]